ncbi:MAG: SPOR domain-containing protein [Thermoanaerobaculia bacterium]
MSEREDSYYEISLTHRQVMWVFVVLLGCVAAAFFAGLWLGKEPPGDTPVVVRTEEGEATQAEEPADGLEPLRFFSEDQEQAPAVESPSRETTLAEDLGAETPEEREPEPAREAAREEPAPAAPQTRTEEATPPASREGLVIQVFSSADRSQAQQLVDRLKKGGHPAFLSPDVVDGRTMFRVRIGPYDERQSAERVAENVRRSYRLDTWITQNS